MIRKDFEKGGFPLSSRTPILSYTKEGNLFVVYNRTDLWKVLNNKEVVKCVGVWPGKKNTDIFPLLPEEYKTIPHLEEEEEIHKNIDSAKDVTATLTAGGAFVRLQYIPDNDPTPIISESEELYKYVLAASLRLKRIRE